MTFGQEPHVDDAPPVEAWQELEAAFDELSRLARSDVATEELHRRILERLVGLLAAIGGIVWLRRGRGLAIECQLNLAQAIDNDAAELSRHQRLAEITADQAEPRLVPPAYRDAELANASPWLAILCPVLVDGKAVAVVEIFQRPEARAAALDGYQRLVRAACEIAEEHHRALALRDTRAQHGELAEIVNYVERIHAKLELASVASAVANEARRVVGCDRVTVLSCLGRRPRVLSVSGVESFDSRSGILQSLEILARMTMSAPEPVWLPEDSDDLPPLVAEQVQLALDESHAKGLGIIPLLAAGGESDEPVGMLAFERFGEVFEPQQKLRAQRVARASGSALANAIHYDRIPLRGLMQWLATMLGLAPGQRWSPALAVSLALAVVGLALWLIPADFSVEARGELMPARRRHVFAPSDGIVVELTRTDGEVVKKGDPLARLHSPALDIEESELAGKQRTVQEELTSAETAALRSELEPESGTSRGQMTARVLQLQEELKGLAAQLEIVRRQQAALAVESPLNGIVITWDPERQLAGRPVKRGDSLLTVADTSGPWQLLLDLPDRSVGHVQTARQKRADVPVSFQLGTNPGVVGQGSVAFVSPATQLSAESQPVVRISVDLNDASTSQFRPGATVVARIHCGRRSLGYVWLHEIWESIRLRLFL
jgi:multidrug efflux pump subunit AcrA (membrane-fusion protein)